MTEVVIDKKYLEKYVELDKKIHEQESKNTIKALSVKESQARDIQLTVQQLQQHYEACRKSTEKERKDVENIPTLRQAFETQASYDAQVSKEQEEYLDALNKEEIAKRELDGVQNQLAAVKADIERMQGEKETLARLYEEYDKLLNEIFKGEYGSEEENRLESELDNLMDQKQRIQTAEYKWTNARQLLATAVSQLNMGCKKWADIIKIMDLKRRYEPATESRNNFVASSQNLTNTHNYLSNIKFPYVTRPEVDTLNKAVSHIYTDLQTPERHSHANNCYTVTHKRAAALLQWFDNVINNTIKKDMQKTNTEVHVAEAALRAERLRLIKAKIAEQGGNSNVSVKGEMDLGKDAASDKNKEYVQQAEPKGKVAPVAVAANVPSSSLAPAPTQEELFGQVEGLKKEHEQQKEEYEKAQMMNKARMEQGLAEKLAARRNRRERMERHEQEAAQLAS